MRKVLVFAALLALLAFGAAAVGAVTVMRAWRDMDEVGEWR